MLAAAKHADVICLFMRNSFSHLDVSLQKETTALIEDLKTILQLDVDLKDGYGALLPQVFNFRIKALRWISKTDQNYLELFDEVAPSFEALLLNPDLKILGQSVIDALSQNQKVIHALLEKDSMSGLELSKSFADLPEITYQQFVASFAYSAPNATAQKILDWVNASLYIEAISLSAMIIYDEGIKVSKSRIKEMAELISNAGNDYGMLSIESGLIGQLPTPEHQRSEDADLLKGMESLMSTGSSFDFLKEEDELYSLSDLKKRFDEEG